MSNDVKEHFSQTVATILAKPQWARTLRDRLDIANSEPPKRRRTRQTNLTLRPAEQAEIDRIRAKGYKNLLPIERLKLANAPMPPSPAPEPVSKADRLSFVLSAARKIEELKEVRASLDSRGNFGAANEVNRQILKMECELKALAAA